MFQPNCNTFPRQPKTEQLRTKDVQRALFDLGFTFVLTHPRRKHLGIIVFRHGEIIPPGFRFPVMRRALADVGIQYRALYDLCYLAAYEAYKAVDRAAGQPEQPKRGRTWAA